MSGFCFPLDIIGGLWESFLKDYGDVVCQKFQRNIFSLVKTFGMLVIKSVML